MPRCTVDRVAEARCRSLPTSGALAVNRIRAGSVNARTRSIPKLLHPLAGVLRVRTGLVVTGLSADSSNRWAVSPRMSRWITRKTLDGVLIRHPIPCYDETSIAAIPGMRTVEECARLLLEEGEQIVGDLHQRIVAIHRTGTAVGYLEISRADDPDRSGKPAETLHDLSMGELQSKLRRARNTVAMLDYPDRAIEVSEEGGALMDSMSDTEQLELRVQCMRVIDEVRCELRRRAKLAAD
jgi:hypothetical protein